MFGPGGRKSERKLKKSAIILERGTLWNRDDSLNEEKEPFKGNNLTSWSHGGGGWKRGKLLGDRRGSGEISGRRKGEEGQEGERDRC